MDQNKGDSALLKTHPADQLLLNVDSELEGTPCSRLSRSGDLTVADTEEEERKTMRSQRRVMLKKKGKAVKDSHLVRSSVGSVS